MRHSTLLRQLGMCLCLLLLMTSALPAFGGGRDTAVDRPNIVVILADDMGFGDVRALNHRSQIPTPHLDALAAAGMTFTDSHSPSAVCTPTRYGLLTGRYCWRSKLKRGVLGGYSPPLLEPGRATIASMLQTAGYQTAAVGKWHLGMAIPMKDGSSAEGQKWDGDPGVDFGGVITDSPIHHGFDSWFGVSASLDMAPYVYIRDDRFTMLPTLQQKAVKFPHFVRSGPRAADFIIDEVLDRLTDESVAYITQASQQERPFFLYVPLTGPHKPTQPHERFRGSTKLGEYGDFIVQVDWTVGRIVKALSETGVADNTLVVFTSDNGSYMYRYDDGRADDHVSDSAIQGFTAEHHAANGQFRGTKADVWEGGHHVPFFAAWPGRISAGSTCDAAICHVDLFATCAEIAEVSLTDAMAEDSCSLLPLMMQQSSNRGAPVIHHSVSGMFAIRDGAWKLVLGNGSGGRQQPKGKPFEKPYELYNLEDDISESRNLAEGNPQVVQRLTQRFEEIRQSGRSVERRTAAD